MKSTYLEGGTPLGGGRNAQSLVSVSMQAEGSREGKEWGAGVEWA